MKLRMVRESAWVNRTYANTGRYQWVREALQNAREADAKRVEFGIEWQAVEKLGVYRRTIIDDGCGMTADELTRFFSALGESGKVFGGIHDNFGIGAKVSMLPWNPDGVVVISYKNGKGAMIRIQLDRSTGDYELAEENVEGVTRLALDPDDVEWDKDEVDWSRVMPEWAREHGTAVVLLGDASKSRSDTVLGDPDQGEADIKGITVFLNTRYEDLSDMEVRVHELRSEVRARWPVSEDDRDDKRRPNVRRIRGARYYIETGTETGENGLAASGTLPLAEGRVRAHWFLWKGPRPPIHSYAKKDGYIAVLYRGELFELTDHAATFRAFGIIPREVQRRVTILLEPQLYRADNGRWGIHPDDARQVLRFTDGEVKAVSVPILDWGHEFVEAVPDAIVAALREARGENEGTVSDEKYRDQLLQKYGKRWRRKIIVQDRVRKGETPFQGDVSGEEVEVEEYPDNSTPPEPPGPPTPPTPRPLRKRPRMRRRKNAPEQGVERYQTGTVPRYEWLNDAVGDEPWHLAAWQRKDPSGTPTVYLSRTSALFDEFVKYYQDQYPPVHAERVQDVIEDTLGQIAVCKAAHANNLTEQGISEEEIDSNVLTSQALTVALMGFLAEEAVISQRLGPLGKKRTAA